MVRTSGVLMKKISHILKSREPITLAVRAPAMKISMIVATTPKPGMFLPTSLFMIGDRIPSTPLKRKRRTRKVMISGTMTRMPDKKYRRNAVFNLLLIDMFIFQKLIHTSIHIIQMI